MNKYTFKHYIIIIIIIIIIVQKVHYKQRTNCIEK